MRSRPRKKQKIRKSEGLFSYRVYDSRFAEERHGEEFLIRGTMRKHILSIFSAARDRLRKRPGEQKQESKRGEAAYTPGDHGATLLIAKETNAAMGPIADPIRFCFIFHWASLQESALVISAAHWGYVAAAHDATRFFEAWVPWTYPYIIRYMVNTMYAHDPRED